MNDKLNTVTAQVHDTKQKVEVNETWQKHKFEKSRDQHEYDALRKIGKELDLAMESHSTMEVVDHINNAREIASNRIFTLRGKDLLIEKAKTLVEVKKVKRQKTYELPKTNNHTYWGSNYRDSEKFFRANQRSKNNNPNSGKCYICEGYGHIANECPSDPNKDNYKQ
ncbi:11555_t:CDS:2 [Acaulospora morrowiae]|uniref:11555_t:CDS:1 n=1 Tax=Acaulospora morrowiae TaxID=94023 RepID=A0A9N9DRL5_9GLOM|nr:11555_t:CDS:2 [Acaulospora morrowiae]